MIVPGSWSIAMSAVRPSASAPPRRRRREQGLTTVELARSCGLSQPFLSKVERGVGRPSIPAIDRVAKALGSSAVGLLAGLDGATRVDVVRGDQRASFRSYGSTDGSGRALTRRAGQLGVVEFEDGPLEFAAEPYRHRNDTVCVILRGAHEFDVEGSIDLLHEGDSLSMAGGVAARYRAVQRPARMLLTFVSEDVEVVFRPSTDWAGVPPDPDRVSPPRIAVERVDMTAGPAGSSTADGLPAG